LRRQRKISSNKEISESDFLFAIDDLDFARRQTVLDYLEQRERQAFEGARRPMYDHPANEAYQGPHLGGWLIDGVLLHEGFADYKAAQAEEEK
jgi:hypothetical protein